MRLFYLLFSCILCALFAKTPDLTPQDLSTHMKDMLQAHVSEKTLTNPLMERICHNFVEQLDPTKTYFLESEVAPWISPSPERVTLLRERFARQDLSPFQEFLETFHQVIQRRRSLEERVANHPLLHDVKSEEFRDIAWVSTPEALLERLVRIRSLQKNAADNLEEKLQRTFLQRIEKRQLSRENSWLEASKEEEQKLLVSLLLKSFASALDAHTNYFTPSEANQFLIQVQQKLSGIGVQLRDDLDGLCVVRILENGPASEQNKLKIHDKIIAVDQEPVAGLDIAEAIELIRGEKGTLVELTVLREGEEKSETILIELVREDIVLEETRLEHRVEPFGDGVIPILRLYTFYQDETTSSAQDIRRVLAEIEQEHKISAILLDLRNNGGGLLSQAVDVSGIFMQKGIVASVKDHLGHVQHLREIQGRPAWKGPLIILVNQASASAAEIVAQTLQDYGRALVVGDPHTFGKGSFQTFTLDAVHQAKSNPKGEYKVTRGLYYTVSGKSPQLHGVESDISIPGLLASLDIGEKFAKFPLPGDQIDPHFEDDLADLPPFQRLRLGKSYKDQIQPRLSTYEKHLPLLRKNSQLRCKNNPTYQKFLEEADKKNFDSKAVELFTETDCQLQEALHIAKDLVLLSH